jgi:excinuclease ABC subunit A
VKSSKKTAIDYNKHIHIKGARSNNLKDIELLIPKNELIVVTGLSGSGKSSLIMDTLYAEGQRRYVESLSSYARQFLNRMKKPEVDFIKGICPAIAIEQKVSSSNARSTVGSLTEIYDYLRLLYARVGKTISPISGKQVKKHSVSDVIDFLKKQKTDSKVQLFIPLQNKYKRTIKKELEFLLQKGYTRVSYKKEIQYIEELLESKAIKKTADVSEYENKMFVLIDRFVIRDEEENYKRIADSVLTAFSESEGECRLEIIGGKTVSFNNRFELDGMLFLEPSHQLFNYNNPFGACPKCEGYGRVLGIDPRKVIPDDSKSVYDEAIACWRGEKSKSWLKRLLGAAHHFDFPVHTAVKDLSEEQIELLYEGNEHFYGINEYFDKLAAKTYKIQNRVMMARYRGRTTCPECKGGRLRKEATYIQVSKTGIAKLIKMPISELQVFFKKLKLSAYDKEVAKRILLEVNNRLQTIMDVGLGYLHLDRLSGTLSGGETQRINLTRTLGSNLTSSLYILDEPSIGLHPKDTEKLVKVIQNLKNLGNTIIVVEHEEDVIRNADYIIDIGPHAGIMGGEVVYSGAFKNFKKDKSSLTSDYLFGRKSIALPEARRKIRNKIELKGASQNNLKNIDVTIPLNALTVVTGVSGSGKSSMVKNILHLALNKELGDVFATAPGSYTSLSGDLDAIQKVELINQKPIGKSSRSNPVTYVKAYDPIRKLFADQQLSKIKGYKPKHFSFNVEGGRCEACSGEGEITVEMQFLADVKLTCEDCNGTRFKDEVREVTYAGKNISEILQLSIEEAITFFAPVKEIINKIKPLHDVGLGYVKLGQSSSTLSGGEAQRVKLASYLGKSSVSEKIFFIFDEPTTGLHFHDILKLMDAFNALIEIGHTVLVVEHNLEVMKLADWIIDLGPEGGKNGGYLLYQGPPEGIVKEKKSFTGQYLKEKLA